MRARACIAKYARRVPSVPGTRRECKFSRHRARRTARHANRITAGLRVGAVERDTTIRYTRTIRTSRDVDRT